MSPPLRIHITGASGSGVSTLGVALAAAIDAVPLEADAYYWLPTTPPFQQKRAPAERLARLLADQSAHPRTVLAGSAMGWGSELEDGFDLVIFLYLDAALRVERLRAREIERLGHADPAFLEWAALYDAGPPEGRSLAKHRAWLDACRCPVVELHGDYSVDERLARIFRAVLTQDAQAGYLHEAGRRWLERVERPPASGAA